MRTSLTLAALAVIAASGACAPHHKPVPPRIGMPEVTAGMEKMRPDVHACYERYKVGGYAQATVRIEPDGSVSEVALRGKFKGTPTGACVIAVVKKARFAKFRSDALVIQYPLLLR